MLDSKSLFFKIGLLIAVATGAGCGDGRDSTEKALEMPSFTDQDLMQGRGVWMQTCRACHLMGIGGAPAVDDFAQWDDRLPKGTDKLVDNVINGILGEDGAYRMPPRGGNGRLTDAQIELAVNYKIAAIKTIRIQAD